MLERQKALAKTELAWLKAFVDSGGSAGEARGSERRSADACRPTLRRMRDDGSGVLRPGQDDHLAVVLARPVPAAVPRRAGVARPAAAWRLRPAGLSAGGRRRAEDGATEGGHARADQGLGSRAGRAAGAGRAARRDRPVRLSGGPRPDGAAPRRGRRSTSCRRSPEEVVRPLAGISASAGSSRRAPRSATTDATRASSSSTPTASRRPRRSRSSPRASGIDLSQSYAYSDSITDLPMLEVVGNPVAVNPDKDLRRIAEERGWQIRDFRRPVRLRTRIASAVPTSKPGSPRRPVAPRWRRSCLGRVPLAQRGPTPTRLTITAPLARARCGLVHRVYGRNGFFGGPRGAEPTRESCRGRHAQDPGARCRPAPEHVRHAPDTCSPRLWARCVRF